MSISPERIVVRFGMAAQVPPMQIAEIGWDVDKRRLRVGDGTSTPTIIMTDKSIGIFEYKFIQYVLYPQINMLPEGTVDGVDISDLNQTNGILVRRGDNLWGARTLTNDDSYVVFKFPDGVSGNPVINFSDAFKTQISNFLSSVAVDNVTIHGNGRPEAPLYAQVADITHKGVVELATHQETIDGVDDARAITPAGLSSRVSTKTGTGVIRLATVQETFDGIDDLTAVTPYDLKQITNSLLAAATLPETLAGIINNKAVTPYDFINARATESQVGTVKLATAADTINHTGFDAVTPNDLSFLSARDNYAGFARFSTLQEVVDGNDNASAVTPAGLQNKKATTSVFGIVRYANDDEIANLTQGVAVQPQDVKTIIDRYSTVPMYSADYMENLGSGVAGNKQSWLGQYSYDSFTYPIFLRFENEDPGFVGAVTGLSGGGGSSNGTGSQVTTYNVACSVKWYPVNGNTLTNLNQTNYTEFTIFQNNLFGIRGYELHPIYGGGSVRSMYFQATTAGGMNRIRYIRNPVTLF